MISKYLLAGLLLCSILPFPVFAQGEEATPTVPVTSDKTEAVPVDINLIASYLDQSENAGLHYTRARPQEIDFAISGDKNYFPACVTINTEDKTIYMATFVGKISPGNEHVGTIMARLMEENYVANWCKVEWDPQKGDIRVSFTYLYDDGFPYQEFSFVKDQLSFSSISVHSLLNNGQPELDESEPSSEEKTTQVTQAQIAELLDQKGISYTAKNDTTLEFDAKGDNATFLVQIRLDPKKNFLYLAIPYIITMPPDSPQAEVIMPALMDLNFRSGLTKFEWFRKAGEIRSSYAFHTKYTFSKTAFMAALVDLIKTTDLAYPALTKLENNHS